MSSFFSCGPPTGGWFPFQDPSPENVDRLLADMKARIASEEQHARLRPTSYEQEDRNLRRFLSKHSMDLEVALAQWHGWVQWRHDCDVDSISDEAVQHELAEGVFQWRGKNKTGMLCCVITGRMLEAADRAGTYSSFKKFLLRVVDEGMQRANENAEQDQICIIYDRRGLDYRHIDPNLHQFCRRTLDELRDWYSDRIGVVYVLSTNWLYYLLYSVVLWPVLALWSKSDRIVVVEDPAELLEHFDEDQLCLLSYNAQLEEEADGKVQTQTQVQELVQTQDGRV